MTKTFEQFVGEERARLQKVREDCDAKRKELDEQIAAIDRELHAITAYEQVRQGKAPPIVTQEPKARRTRGARARRGSREELKTKITELLKQHPEGMVASQITAAIPEATKQIPNVLSIMKKDGLIKQEARRGPYFISLDE